MANEKILLDFSEYKRLLNCEKDFLQLKEEKRKISSSHANDPLVGQSGDGEISTAESAIIAPLGQSGNGEISTSKLGKIVLERENGPSDQTLLPPITSPPVTTSDQGQKAASSQKPDTVNKSNKDSKQTETEKKIDTVPEKWWLLV